MRKVVILATLLLMLAIAGFSLNRSARAMKLKLHAKDLPEHGLTIISPADPSFDGRMNALLKGERNGVAENLKPFSVFVKNQGSKTVVAYVIQWCFTNAEDQQECYRKAVINPTALMEGEELPEDMEEQSGRIKPGATRFFSLVSLDGGGPFSVKVSREEAERFRRGEFDRVELLRRYSAELAKYSNLTVSIDGAFFEDGTFVGPDTAGFFETTQAMIDARSDLLSDIASGLSKPGSRSRDEAFVQVEAIARQAETELKSSSTPDDYYNHFKRAYASELLRVKDSQGIDQGLVAALRPMRKPWPMLRRQTNK